MKKYIISGIVGAAVVILVIVVITSFVTPINYAPIYLLNPEKALTYNDSLVIDSIKCAHIEVLRDLESKGVLLNPSEYTSHITDYYNSLITILLGLFAIFTFGTIYSIKSASKKEIDDIKTDIENHKVRTNAELKQNIVGALSELMRDSISFKDTCINALYGRIEDEILRHEDKEAIDWKSHATLTLLAKQDLPTFGCNMIDPLKSWCWGSILFYPFKISRFS